MTYQQYRAEIEALQKRLDEIKALCLRYNHPGCNPGAHALANKVLRIADKDQERKYE